jgi:cbb3-type cytochrome c oxidase subunit II
MKMTPALLIIGGLLVFWSAVYVSVILPWSTMPDDKSAAWLTWTPEEAVGHDLYIRNGCSYCHSQFVRAVDWADAGAGRLAERGDYFEQEPAILGTERVGPDLSQEGGEHSDDWQKAHFMNPRNTRPLSLMPSWEFLGDEKISQLTAYVRSLGGKNAAYRVARQDKWKVASTAAWKLGVDKNVDWLHEQVPAVWRPMPNPYPATEAALQRGEKTYQTFCIGCHGPMGDGQGPAVKYMEPPPLNFTVLRRHLVDGKYIGGIFYYQIMNGITGTGMPYFKRELQSEKIWDVSNYIAVRFVGYTDATLSPQGIPAAYEPAWENTFKPPNATGESK